MIFQEPREKKISNIDMVELSIFEKYNIFEREFVDILPRFVYCGIDYIEPEHREIILKGIKTLLKNKVKIPHPKRTRSLFYIKS